jgi:hypothetical protein
MITAAKVAILRAVIIFLIPVSPLLHFAEITFLSLKSGKNACISALVAVKGFFLECPVFWQNFATHLPSQLTETSC